MRGRLASVLGVMAVAMGVPGAAQAAGPVGVGHSGWFWGNPLPQGNTLNAVDFQGARGYAVGADGTVLRSDDAGATWNGLGAGTQQSLSLVQMAGPNTVFVGGGCSLRRSDNAGTTFSRLPFTPSDSRCQSFASAISFTSPSVGYVLLANGTVLRTTDGGRSFGQRTSVPGATSSGQTGTATDIDFVSDTTGTAIAGGRVYRTINGGDSWTAVSAAGGKADTLAFVDATHAVAVGDGGTFLTSADGGATFVARPLTGEGAGKTLTGVSCSDASTCVMSIANASQVVRTADGGATSTLVAAGDDNVLATDFGPPGRVVGVGAKGLTVTSSDSGASFTPVGGRLATAFGSIRSAYGLRAYAVGPNGRVARTVDGGRTWTPFGVSTGGDIRDVSFPTPAVGYALDDQGAVLRTDNAGESWRILDPGVDGAFALMALDANRLAVIGPRGVRRSTNGGRSFGSSRSRAVRGKLLTDVDRAGSAIVAWSDEELVLSRNGGTTWTKVSRPKGAIESVDFLDRNRGYLSAGGRLYVTRNGGRRWRRLGAVGRFASGVSFSDFRHGFVAGDGGPLLRTDDGGATWEPQLVGPTGVSSVAASSGKGAFGSGDGFLFGTNTGGHLGRSSRLTLKPAARRVRRGATLRVQGKLTPASPGSVVTVTLRRGQSYRRKTAVVASTGAFTVSFKIPGPSTLIAQWRGDDRLDGDGTAEVKVATGKAKRTKKKGGSKRR